MTTGERIRAIRIEKKLTQKQVGDRCGMADSNIRAYELGKANPKIETLQRIATALEVPIGFLLGMPVNLDGEIERIEKQFPAATVTETDDKVIFHIIEKPAEVPDSESLRRKLLLEKYDALTPKGKLKVLDYTCELSRLPEYRQTSKKGKDE